MPHSIPYNAKIFEARNSQNRKSSTPFASFGASPLGCSAFGPSGQLLSLPLSILYRFQHTSSPFHPYSPFPLEPKASKLRISTSSGRVFGVQTFGPPAFKVHPRALSTFVVSSTLVVLHRLSDFEAVADHSVILRLFVHALDASYIDCLYSTLHTQESSPPPESIPSVSISVCVPSSLWPFEFSIRSFAFSIRSFASQAVLPPSSELLGYPILALSSHRAHSEASKSSGLQVERLRAFDRILACFIVPIGCS